MCVCVQSVLSMSELVQMRLEASQRLAVNPLDREAQQMLASVENKVHTHSSTVVKDLLMYHSKVTHVVCGTVVLCVWYCVCGTVVLWYCVCGTVVLCMWYSGTVCVVQWYCVCGTVVLCMWYCVCGTVVLCVWYCVVQ